MLIDSDWSDFELWQFQSPLFVGCWRIPLCQTHLWSISSHKGGLSYFMDKTSTVKPSWKQRQTKSYLNTWNEQRVQRFLFKKIVLHLWFSTPNSKLWWEMSSVRDNHVKVKGLLKLPKGGQKNHVFPIQQIMSRESMWQKIFFSALYPLWAERVVHTISEFYSSKRMPHSSSCTMRTSKEQTFKCLLDLRDVVA